MPLAGPCSLGLLRISDLRARKAFSRFSNPDKRDLPISDALLGISEGGSGEDSRILEAGSGGDLRESDKIMMTNITVS
jgi:hypothetical protein